MTGHLYQDIPPHGGIGTVIHQGAGIKPGPLFKADHMEDNHAASIDPAIKVG